MAASVSMPQASLFCVLVARCGRAYSLLTEGYTIASRSHNTRAGVTHRIYMAGGWRLAWGIARSLWIYYRSPGRRRRMDHLYARFVRPGDLVFDIGSHVGDRIASFRRLGCQVVAVEPQPPLVALLRRLYGRSPAVTIEPVAVAAAPGT